MVTVLCDTYLTDLWVKALLFSIIVLSEGADTMYYFTALALTLNEPEEGVAPTDSRRRPDQRLMEDGRWDEANAEKQRLEEKQRSVRREREREAASQRTSSQSEEGQYQTCSRLYSSLRWIGQIMNNGVKISLWPAFLFLPKSCRGGLSHWSLTEKQVFVF